ncbi:MAG: TonB-dependent receptor [Candidatus Acidiferrales bacterium]
MTRKLTLFFVAFAVALLALCAPPALAQNQGATTGNLAGTVADSSGATVPDAMVTITGPQGSKTLSTTSDGRFNFRDLVPGDYAVKVEKQGFATFSVPAVEVLINNTATVQATLQTGAVSTTLEVTSSAITVDPTQSSINTNLSDTFYSKIPVQRNVSAIMYLAPGVVSGLGTGGGVMSNATVQGSSAANANPSISGASGLENLYVADGVVLNDPSYGGLGGFSTVYGALGVGITPAFVKEEEVKTAGFEPQYGHATGGVIQIVTKSGSTKFHGTIGGYFESPGMQSTFANKDDFQPVNLIGRHLDNGDYEGDFELGGYVPFLGLRNKLFFFGAFNPTFFNDYEAPALGSGLFTIYNGQVNRRTNTYAYAGKLTYKLTDNITAESSVFGDPAHTTHSPFSTMNADNISGNSKWDFGTRNWDTRVYATISPSWTADFAFTYSWNHFTETPADTTIYPITDQTQSAGLAGQRGEFQAQGLGTGIIVDYQAHQESLNFDTQKSFNFAGSHTLSLGYFWQYPTYDNSTIYSTPKYTVPSTNATGGDPGTGVAAGQVSDAAFELQLAPGWDPVAGAYQVGATPCTLCPNMAVPGVAGGLAPVVLFQVRGRFDGGLSHSTGKYHAAYVNDSWQMSSHVTLNLGLRWEQQRLTGLGVHALFNDQWSPRIGFIVSPNPESKIYADFDRLAFVIPLDMAVRELGGEADNFNEYWAPVATGPGNTIQASDLDQYGTVQFQGDAAHLLTNAVGGVGGVPLDVSVPSAGNPFASGTRFEYNDEWVVGAEHKFHGGFFVSARYIDRRMKRVIEDMIGQSVEQFYAAEVLGLPYSYSVGNPGYNFTHFVTPNEITWAPGAMTTPSGCFDSNGNETPYVSGKMYTSFNEATGGPSVGSACFPAVNMNPWTDASGNVLPGALFGGEFYNGACPTLSGRSLCKPGYYPDAVRNYQAVEFEVNKAFSNNWLLRSNLRVGRLLGNYEGAFRNDNGQSDPGISSLYDLAPGDLGLLGHQFDNGPLNTDRKYVLNVEPSYTIPSGFAKNLVLGTAVRVESGIPLTTLYAQQAYQNPGEVPVNGRGDLGRSPVTGTIDAHVEYPWKFGEEKQLKFSFDAFNIANTKRSVLSTQEADLAWGILNQDFFNHIPLTFVPPFSARFGVLFTF